MPSLRVIVAGSLLAFGTTVASAAGLMTVSQRARGFAVTDARIARGEAIRFLNEDTFLHQVFVQSTGLAFESNEQAPGESVDIRFATSGLFEVRCHIHPKMLLRVDVR